MAPGAFGGRVHCLAAPWTRRLRGVRAVALQATSTHKASEGSPAAVGSSAPPAHIGHGGALITSPCPARQLIQPALRSRWRTRRVDLRLRGYTAVRSLVAGRRCRRPDPPASARRDQHPSPGQEAQALAVRSWTKPSTTSSLDITIPRSVASWVHQTRRPSPWPRSTAPHQRRRQLSGPKWPTITGRQRRHRFPLGRQPAMSRPDHMTATTMIAGPSNRSAEPLNRSPGITAARRCDQPMKASRALAPALVLSRVARATLDPYTRAIGGRPIMTLKSGERAHRVGAASLDSAPAISTKWRDTTAFQLVVA